MSGTYNRANSALITALVALSAKNPKLVKSTAYWSTIDGADTKIWSWKMNEFKYYDIPSPFPTLARGLFTRELDSEGAKKRYQIVVRGYDKFFNIGEVPWTTWESLEAHTAAPYILSLKSNGCIIFIAAVTPTQLIVTSKHSMGAVDSSVQTQSMSHAQAGEVWLRKYLAKLGKEEKDMAQELWEKNWTAIAELCDDNFEEHVLGYPPEKTGLHLHGLNVRSRHFITEDPEVVDDFAERWGFIKTPWTTVNTIKDVRKFTDECAERGEWKGEPVEGFVVRTRVTDVPTSGRSGGADPSHSPYDADSSFFFKVKFDEPYMMYRDWREVTKMLLSSKSYLNPSLLPKSKTKRPETKLYIKWVINEIKKDPKAFETYTRGKGIIKTRERYLEWLKSDKGEKDLEEEVHNEQKGAKEFTKTIIVPIAIPGCGKTAVSVALAHIFGFGHTQSDDVQAKKPAPVFIKNVTRLLKKKDVVIADKNNHLKQHRQQLRDAVKSSSVRLLALNWGVVDKAPAIAHRICSDRITQRGDNHQTLRVEASSSSTAAKKHEEVLWMFLNTFEELAEGEVDDVVDISLDSDLETAVRQAITACVAIIGVPQPSDDKIQEALDVVGAYTVSSKTKQVKENNNKGKNKPQQARYYALLPEVDISSLLQHHLSDDTVPEAVKEFWTYLKSKKRVVKVPHVTIAHRSNLFEAESKELWVRCEELYAMPYSPFFRGKLGSLLCDPMAGVMALTFENLELDAAIQKQKDDNASDDGEGQEAQTFVSTLPHSVRQKLHITIGTMGDTKAVEAGEMVMRWRADERNNIEEVKLQDVFTRGRIQAMQG